MACLREKNATVKSNNYTYNDKEVIDKLAMIKEVKNIGFTLAEIKVLIDACHSKKLPVEKRKQVLLVKMKEVDGKIKQLKGIKKKLPG